ncbi:MAG: GNAT family protein [Thermotaleaceae bacterium]
MKDFHENIIFPKIETEDLLLRKIELSDATRLLAIWSNKDVTKYMNIEPFENLEQVKDMVELLNSLFEQREANRWAIVLKEKNCVIGTCGYNRGLKEEDFLGEIGYELDKAYWGKGYGTEALKAVIDYGFEQLELNRIEAMVMLENIQSTALLKRLGFKEEGILREHGFYKGRYWDEYCYSLLKREWKNPQSIEYK